MYDSTKEYTNKDKYLEFAGIDLDIELKSSQYDNPTLAVDIFIKQQQTWLYTYMTIHFNTVDWEQNWDDDVFSQALLWHIKHVLKYGEDNLLDKMAYGLLRNSGMANPKYTGVW